MASVSKGKILIADDEKTFVDALADLFGATDTNAKPFRTASPRRRS